MTVRARGAANEDRPAAEPAREPRGVTRAPLMRHLSGSIF